MATAHNIELAEQLGQAARNNDVEQLYRLLCRGADLSMAVGTSRQRARGFETSIVPRAALELALEGRRLAQSRSR